MGKISDIQFDPKRTFRKLAIGMLEKIKNEYNNSGKYWENLGDEKDKKSEKYRLEKLESELDKFKEYISSEQNDNEKYDKDIAEHLEKLENAFLYTISKLPWKDRDENCHYPVGENKVTDKFLDKVADAINDGNADQLNGENFATVLLPNESIENSNIKYAIPQCIKGDITNAKLYHCLLNPGSGISDTKDNYDNFYDYLHDKDAMKDHLRIFDENGRATKEKLVEYMNDLKKNMLITEFEDFIEKYGNCTISENKVDEIFDNDGKKEFYYIMEYYKTLVAKGIGDFREILKNHLSNLETLSDNLKDVKLCNLELSPVRSKIGKTIINMIDENSFAVSIVLRRICIYELSNDDRDSMQPIFIFRTYDKWKKRINEYIKKNFEKEDAKNIIDYLTKNYFLKLNQSGVLSKNNILTINYCIKINDELFDDINHSMGIDSSQFQFLKFEYRKVISKKNKINYYTNILLKYKNNQYTLKTGIKKGKMDEKDITNNMNQFIDEIKLALRAYKYINDTQNTFTSGLETSKPKK